MEKLAILSVSTNTLYDVVDKVIVFDTGIEDSVVGGGELSRRRRHLISFSNPLHRDWHRNFTFNTTTADTPLNHTYKRKLLRFANAGRRVGKSLFTGLFRTFTGGL